MFTEDGYFTIRRKNIYFNGNFTDQTIDQKLMHSIKAQGGLKHGQRITENTLSQWVHSIPHCIPICQYLEDYTGVFSSSSAQHKDLRPKTQEGDINDLNKFIEYNKKNKLILIATGEVADDTVNCELAYEIGTELAESITGKDFVSVKLKR